jgi:hypothetical protein
VIWLLLFAVAVAAWWLVAAIADGPDRPLPPIGQPRRAAPPHLPPTPAQWGHLTRADTRPPGDAPEVRREPR